MKAVIKNANQWMFNNLFWIVPLYFFMLMGGIATSILQRIQIKSNTELTIEKQNVILQNQDSLKINNNINSLQEVLKKYQRLNAESK